jgi:hypothetical protein
MITILSAEQHREHAADDQPPLHHKVLAIALANKLARIAWAVLAKDRQFEMRRTSEAVARPA